jgi:hypothetical protein
MERMLSTFVPRLPPPTRVIPLLLPLQVSPLYVVMIALLSLGLRESPRGTMEVSRVPSTGAGAAKEVARRAPRVRRMLEAYMMN